MSFATAPFPTQDALVDKRGIATQVLIDWATALSSDVDAAPARLGTPVTVTAQVASIGPTAFNVGSLPAGLYRASFVARVTTPATVSSSLTVTIGYTNGGVTCTESGAAMTSNAVALPKSGAVLVNIDGNTPITWSTTYVSVGATALTYQLTVTLEQVSA